MAKNKVSQGAVWVILALLIVALMGFGATNFSGGGQSVATVGSKEISAERYARALQNDMRNLQRQVGRPITMIEAQSFGLDRAALARLISEAGLQNEADEIGLSVGDETVSREILDVPAFRGLSGDFDRESYAFTLRENGLTVAEFETQMRAEIATRLLTGAVSAGLTAPDGYVLTLFDYAREGRDATWARLTTDNLDSPLDAAPDTDLREYYEANPAPFTRPETRAITYAWITPEMLLDTVDIDEAQVQNAYAAQADDLNTPERRLVERLIYLNPDDAAAAKARLDSGETTFDELVVERGLTLADVDMGDVTARQLGSAAEDVFALTEPGVVGPIVTDLGPAIFRMNAILAGREVSFEDVRDELRDALAAEQAARVIRDQIEDFDDLLAGGATLEELASESEMELGQIDWTPDATDGIAATPEFANAATRALEGDFPELIEMESGGLFALRLDEIQPPALRPLEEVRDQVAALLQDSRVADALEERANDLAEEIRSGRELAGLGLALSSQRGLTRDDLDSDLTAVALAALFEMEEGDIRVVRDGNEITLLRLDQVLPADRTTPEAQAAIAAFADNATGALAQDLLGAYSQAVVDGAGLEIDAQALQAINAQLN